MECYLFSATNMIVGPVEEATVAEACCADCEGRPYEW